MNERTYQSELIKRIKHMLPGCVILKNDSGYLQGFPDLLILYGERWAALEVKRSRQASLRPNQMYYIETLGQMGYAAFIYPENEKEVLYEVQQTLRY